MRSKEEAHDYRYFPDPDLLPLVIEESWVAEIAASLPELPDDKKARFIARLWNLRLRFRCARRRARACRLLRGAGEERRCQLAVNWLNNEILGRLNRDGRGIADCPVSAAASSAILGLIADGTISGKIAKDVLDIAWSEGGDPATIVNARGLAQVTNSAAIENAIEAVIAANPGKVEELKLKPKTRGWFVGQVMKQTGGKANPQVRERAAQRPSRTQRRGVIRTLASR